MIIGIAAIDLNNGIGKNNKLLFKIPEDLKHFAKLTKNNIVVMGHNTYNSIGHALPDRVNIVLSHTGNFTDCLNFRSIKDILDYAENTNKDIYIIGGTTLYKQMMPYYDKLIITKVFAKEEADTFFPTIDKRLKLVEKSDIINTNSYNIQFLIYKREKIQ